MEGFEDKGKESVLDLSPHISNYTHGLICVSKSKSGKTNKKQLYLPFTSSISEDRVSLGVQCSFTAFKK